MKTNKTNAARLLDRAKIPYELVPYEVDENNLAATHVAEQLGENIEQVFKTLVLRGDKHGIFVCVIPGDKEVDSLELVVKIGAQVIFIKNDPERRWVNGTIGMISDITPDEKIEVVLESGEPLS